MISVIIPTFNRAQTLIHAAESVLKQTYTDVELIIVDDGSTDNTFEVVKNLRDSRVRYFRFPENLGACAARNKGIEEAAGEFIAFQDSDDFWLPDKLENQMMSLEKTGADLCICRYYVKSGEKTLIGPLFIDPGLQNDIKTIYGIGTQTLLGRAEIFKLERFDPRMPRFQDLELLYRLTKLYSVCVTEKPLVKYCVREDSIGKNPVKLLRACELLLELHPNLHQDFPFTCRQISRALFCEAGKKRLKERWVFGKWALKMHFSAQNLWKMLFLIFCGKVPFHG